MSKHRRGYQVREVRVNDQFASSDFGGRARTTGYGYYENVEKRVIGGYTFPIKSASFSARNRTILSDCLRSVGELATSIAM